MTSYNHNTIAQCAFDIASLSIAKRVQRVVTECRSWPCLATRWNIRHELLDAARASLRRADEFRHVPCLVTLFNQQAKRYLAAAASLR